MANEDVKIKAVLDAGEVASGLQKLGGDLDTSLDRAAGGAKRLADGMKGAADASKATALQVGQVAIGMAGLATRLAASVAEARGYTSAAGYLQSMGSMAVSGAMMASRFGVKGLVAGAVGGAALGAGMEWFDQRGEEDARAAKEREAAQARSRSVDEYDRLATAGEASAQFFRRMADESVSAADKQRDLAERTRMFAAAADRLREALKSEDVLSDAERFGATMRKYAQATGELAKMRAIDLQPDRIDKGGGTASAERAATDALGRIGGSIGGGAADGVAALMRDGNAIARAQLDSLRRIERGSEGGRGWA